MFVTSLARATAVTESSDCSACHLQIYQEWQTSWMARANSNPNFQAHFKRWQSQAAKYATATNNPPLDPRACQRCHAPEINVGAGPQRQDGVTCLTCHAVRKVREGQYGHELSYDSRNIIYGPGRENSFAPHLTKQGDHFLDSSLCAGCHRDIAPNGVALERTYEEWRGSQYAEQSVQCADCHMPKIDGAPSSSSAQSQHASHRFPGGHADSPLLKGAAKLELKQVAGKIVVTVINQAVGHHFPTGGAHPNKLMLKAEFLDAAGAVLAAEERVYRYDYLASEGGMRALDKIIDTTLRPGERREELLAPVMARAVRVRVWLEYQIVPEKLLRQLSPKDYAPVRIDEAVLDLTP
ncbi:MAG: hypothetical protein HY272_07010 [Gammaproteobacteria bacterium]|nr:hypothetical protein [Gammaproteobacteria bacterium]